VQAPAFVGEEVSKGEEVFLVVRSYAREGGELLFRSAGVQPREDFLYSLLGYHALRVS